MLHFGAQKYVFPADVARHLEVAVQTFHRWRNQYGACEADDVKRLKCSEFEQPSSPLSSLPDPNLLVSWTRRLSSTG